MQRYFGNVLEGKAVLSEEDVHHLTHVMRARVGESVEVVSDGQTFKAIISCLKPLKLLIMSKIEENNELPNKVILIASLLKGEKMDFVLQKATELGVSQIVLLQSERTIVKIKNDDKEYKIQRFQKILKEAAEQSKRNRIPFISGIITFDQLDNVDADLKLIAYEGEQGKTTSFVKQLSELKKGTSVAVLIGPEGGFSEKEVKIANNCGYQNISLGKRILRAETASLYALSVISNYIERK